MAVLFLNLIWQTRDLDLPWLLFVCATTLLTTHHLAASSAENAATHLASLRSRVPAMVELLKTFLRILKSMDKI